MSSIHGNKGRKVQKDQITHQNEKKIKSSHATILIQFSNKKTFFVDSWAAYHLLFVKQYVFYAVSKCIKTEKLFFDAQQTHWAKKKR